MNFIDFSIAVLLANAMPHFIFGITKVRFLGLLVIRQQQIFAMHYANV